MSVQILADEDFQPSITTATTLHHYPEKQPLNVLKNQDRYKRHSKDDQQEQEVKNKKEPLHLVIEKCKRHAIVRYETEDQQHHANNGLVERQADVLKFLSCY